jgi:peptidoglycan hydrolase-like protein with peptidoglycan-binding domain
LGPKTQAAVKSFQQSKGLPASGQLDQRTLTALGVSGEAASASAGSSAERTAEPKAEQAKDKPTGESSAGASQQQEQPKAQQEQPKEKSNY